MAQRKSSTKRKTAAPKKTAAARSAAKKNKKNIMTNEYFLPHIFITALAAVLLGIFMYIGENGIINVAVRHALVFVFGTAAYLIPPMLAGLAVYLIVKKNVKQFWIKLTLSAAALVCLSAVIQLSTADTLFTVAASNGSGGWAGALVAVAMVKLVQKIASYIILILALLILIGAIVEISTVRLFAAGAKKAFLKIKEMFFDFKDRVTYEYEDEPDEQRNFTNEDKKEIIDAANMSARDFDGDKAKKPMKKRVEKPQKTESASNEPERPAEFVDDGIDRVFSELDAEFENSGAVVISDVKPSKVNTEEIPAESPAETTAESLTKTMEQAAETEKSTRKKAKITTDEEKESFNNEFDEAKEKETLPYVFPPIDLLGKPASTVKDQRNELKNTARKLITILEDFGVRATLLQVTQGPAVTRYEIQPDTGVKLSKISGLADDIALNLAVNTVLVAPVPGKAAVGIEIPNNKISSVSAREIIETDEFKNAKSKLTFALGKDIGGGVIIGDIAKMPHLLIAGATGSGKSVCINTIITSLLYKASPDDLKLIMVDPKVVELGVYNGIPHLLVPVVTDPKKAAGALNWAVTEMMRRYDLFKETGVRKLEAYNKLMESTGGKKEPQLVIIIDELADLMMVAAKEVEDYICRIAQLARAAGIHLIIATQRPSVDVITGLIKANIPSRIAFAVSSQVDSRTILDKGGAEKLLGMGDMLYHPTGAREAKRVQGAFVSDEEIERIITFIKETSGEGNHYSEDLAEQIERCATGENGVTPDAEDDGDALLPDAIALAVDLGKISTSMVQRRLGVGYSRAGRIIDQMEARGIISGANGSKPRDVLVSHADMTPYTASDYGEE